MNRRGLILGAFAAPFIIRTPGLIMPIKPVKEVDPELAEFLISEFRASIERLSDQLIEEMAAQMNILSGIRRSYSTEHPRKGHNRY